MPESIRVSPFYVLVLTVAALSLVSIGSPTTQDNSPKGKPMAKALPSAEEIKKLPPDGGPEFNRLIHENSPYLLQHARNPVDWYPWGPEAFAKAKKEDKPIFLSVGYSTCHWCHVMERESFENKEVAAVMNKFFVSIKVDREERPDIDEIYMNATQLLTGHGGWPNSVWLTPDGRPWFAGTYFPPDDRFGRPGFKTILERTAELWKTRRADIEEQANQLSEAIKQTASLPEAKAPVGELNWDLIDRVLRTLDRTFDEQHGGFGGAPKFPPHGSLAILLYEYSRTRNESILTTATRTLDAMALGGIHDQIGGGFHRYSTDDEWFLPHFEKMLYDNAQLASAYTQAFALTGEARYRRVAEDTLDWALRDMASPEGGFYSALDADSEGEEGKFYLWTPQEVKDVLGDEEGGFFCRVYNIVPGGNFHDQATGHRPGSSIPFLDAPPAELARKEGVEGDSMIQRLARDRAKLLERRNRRVWPHLDDKVLVAWNGLMISALAVAGKTFHEPRYTDAAEKAADFILSHTRKSGRLFHSWRAGEINGTAFLDDYSFLIRGILDLYETTGDAKYLDESEKLTGDMIRHFWDDRDGGFFFTPDDHENLLVRSKDLYDQAIPSGNGMAGRVLVRLAAITGKEAYRTRARALFDAFLPVMYRIPRGTESLILSATMYLDSPEAAPGGTKPVNAKASEAETSTTMGKKVASPEPKGEKPDTAVYRKPVRLELFLSQIHTAPGGDIRVALRIKIDKGWHLNSHAPLQDYLIPTRFRLSDNAAATLTGVTYPKGEKTSLGFSQEALSVYRGDVWISATLHIAEDAPPGELPLAFLLNTQACNDQSCLAPEMDEMKVTIRVGPQGTLHPIRHRTVFHARSTE